LCSVSAHLLTMMQACDLVIRFDPLQHMVGYLQSRGRARHRTSTFVIMVPRGSEQHILRYRAFAESEPHLKQIYHAQNADPPPVAPESELEEGEYDEEPDPADLAARERYIVPSTRAVLTYHSAVGMLNHLCALIPRDRYTPARTHAPRYTGDFEAVLQLPPSLPLPPEHLVFVGPPRRSKREAKGAVAFAAVRRLHQLGVFDDYLLPVRGANDTELEDADGQRVPDVSDIPDPIRARVRDPWVMGPNLWMHVVRLDGEPTSAIVTGTSLPPVSFVHAGSYVEMSGGKVVAFDAPVQQREMMQAYTWSGIKWCITWRGTRPPLTCFLIPITQRLQPDWEALERVQQRPWGTSDWTGISEADWQDILCMNSREHGRVLTLRRIRHDLTPLSAPPPDSREAAAGYATYKDFFTYKWGRRGLPLVVPDDGPLAEVSVVKRRSSGVYPLYPSDADLRSESSPESVTFLVPYSFLRRLEMTAGVWRVFHLLPRLLHRATDLYRVRRAKQEMCLPPIPDDLLVEAYTLPHTGAGFSNQRLETLGDAVLKLLVVVNLLNKFRYRHEGQLDVMRRLGVANRTLLARAKAVGLENYLSCETMSMRAWRHVLSPDVDPFSDPRSRRFAEREFARRCLQDCVEATLGAAFLGGGIPMALQAGSALGLSLGGPLPWTIRYSRKAVGTVTAALFQEVQAALHYEFFNGKFLVEANTHPSVDNVSGSSYQRLEFVGDGAYLHDFMSRLIPNLFMFSAH
jgi:endoribonuclease Dicer